MSQWGKEKNINGSRFVPLVSTKPFEPASDHHLIVDIILLDGGKDNDLADIALNGLKEKHIGKPYSEWQATPLASETKLYAWQPEGHGPLSFFVAADSKQEAEESVRRYLFENKTDNYDRGGWPLNFELSVVEKGIVVANDNS